MTGLDCGGVFFRILLLLGALQVTLFPHTASAVLPPDLVMSVGSQAIGFFSLFVALAISAAAAFGTLFFWCTQWCKRNLVWVIITTLAVVLLAAVLYLWSVQSVSKTQTSERSAEQAQQAPAPPSDSFAATTTIPAVITPAREKASACQTCAFYSDSVTLFAPDGTQPFVLEIDINRREELDSSFSHHYFLDGLINNTKIKNYTQSPSPDFLLQPYSFVSDIARVFADDMSARDVYVGTIETSAGTVSFETAPLQGDFLSRNRPEYTQFQSVTRADVTFNNKTVSAFALVENVLSNNYEERIYFPGYQNIEANTNQFILWDEADNFYMIDQSEVLSDTPEYPSHTWLLHKDMRSGKSQKSFTATIEEAGYQEWHVYAPAFDNATITLSLQNTYKPEQDGRARHVVTGVITDNAGTRSISGLLKAIK